MGQMKWFEHQCDAAENKKIRKIERWGAARGGEDGAMAAVGRYWRLLERLGKEEEQTGYFEYEDGYDLELIADDLMAGVEYVRDFLDLLASLNAIEPDLWQKEAKVACPKLAERADEYYKRRQQRKEKNQKDKPKKPGFSPQPEPEPVPAVSEECPDTIPTVSENPCVLTHVTLHTTQKKLEQASAWVAEPAAPSGGAPPPEADDSASLMEDSKNVKSLTPRFGPANLMQLWNDTGCRPRVSELTDERRKKAGLRIRKRGDPAWWRGLFEKVQGLNKPWLTFDFLMRSDTNCLKVLEGNYDHDFGSKNFGSRRPAAPGAHQKPDPANHGKFASRVRILSTDPGGGGQDPEKDSPGQGGVPGARRCPAI
jgi:hypothetical protein